MVRSSRPASWAGRAWLRDAVGPETEVDAGTPRRVEPQDQGVVAVHGPGTTVVRPGSMPGTVSSETATLPSPVASSTDDADRLDAVVGKRGLQQARLRYVVVLRRAARIALHPHPDPGDLRGLRPALELHGQRPAVDGRLEIDLQPLLVGRLEAAGPPLGAGIAVDRRMRSVLRQHRAELLGVALRGGGAHLEAGDVLGRRQGQARHSGVVVGRPVAEPVSGSRHHLADRVVHAAELTLHPGVAVSDDPAAGLLRGDHHRPVRVEQVRLDRAQHVVGRSVELVELVGVDQRDPGDVSVDPVDLDHRLVAEAAAAEAGDALQAVRADQGELGAVGRDRLGHQRVEVTAQHDVA